MSWTNAQLSESTILSLQNITITVLEDWLYHYTDLDSTNSILQLNIRNYFQPDTAQKHNANCHNLYMVTILSADDDPNQYKIKSN